MPEQPQAQPFSTNRRDFLFTTAAAATLPAAASLGSAAAVSHAPRPQSSEPRHIPIGVFTVAFDQLDIGAVVDKVKALGLEAVEIGTGNYVQTKHCPLDRLIEDKTAAAAWKRRFEDSGIRVMALSCHGNPLHPRAEIARAHDAVFRKTVLLAERLDIPTVVGFSGCPGDSPNASYPNWVTYGWPDDYSEILKWQWNERVLPYWTDTAKFLRAHRRRVALEMHPGFIVYNPRTLLALRRAAGEEIGANCDLSHLFWQGCDAVEVVRMLTGEGALFHAHMKDTVLFPQALAKYGVLGNNPPDTSHPAEIAVMFRAVGFGHSAELWKEVVRTYMAGNYQGMFSIENEDPILSGENGVRAATEVLRAVRDELVHGSTLARRA